MSTPINSITAGWDAVCAYDAGAVSALFFQQFLMDNPEAPVAGLSLLVPTGVGSTTVAISLALGPPDIAVTVNNAVQECDVTIPVLSGLLVYYDAGWNQVESVIFIQPNTSWLTGPVSLSAAKGQINGLGSVTVDLAKGAYSPTLAGIVPESELAATVGAAIAGYFATTPITYTIGTIAIPSGLCAALTPTQFSFATQYDPSGVTDGAILLLIETNGGGGIVAPLAVYPLSPEYDASLLVSNEVIFDEVLPAGMTAANTVTTQTTNIGVVPTGGSYYVTQTQSGQANIGTIPANTNNWDSWFTGDGFCNPQALVMDLQGFELAPDGSGNITASYSLQGWSPTWNMNVFGPDPNCSSDSAPIDVSYAFSTGLQVAGNGVVSMVTPTPTVSLDQTSGNSFWDELIGEVNVQGDFASAFNQNVTAALSNLTLPDIDTFALQSILFPGQQVLSFSTAGIPCDLQLNGIVVPPLQVTPSSVVVAPGATQAFASSGSDVSWSLSGAGSIDAQTGIYTAPATLPNGNQAAIVTSINQADLSQSASALIVVAPAVPPSTLVISPSQVMVTATANGACDFTVQTSQGTAATSVSCTLSPSTAGQMMEASGVWTFTPAPVVQAPAVAIATFTDGSGDSGTISITIVGTVETSLTSSAETVSPGESFTVTVIGSTVGPEWIVSPPDIATLTIDALNNAEVTVAVAPSATGQVTIAALSVPSSVQQTSVGVATVSIPISGG